MGAFNTVTADLACPRCGRASTRTVQFKYGSTWQLSYAIGDTLSWGGNDHGRPGARRVVLDGAVESPCPKCEDDSELNAYIFLECDRIASVAPDDGAYDFVDAENRFIVIQE
jgi:hypothetical protein